MRVNTCILKSCLISSKFSKIFCAAMIRHLQSNSFTNFFPVLFTTSLSTFPRFTSVWCLVSIVWRGIIWFLKSILSLCVFSKPPQFPLKNPWRIKSKFFILAFGLLPTVTQLAFIEPYTALSFLGTVEYLWLNVGLGDMGMESSWLSQIFFVTHRTVTFAYLLNSWIQAALIAKLELTIRTISMSSPIEI